MENYDEFSSIEQAAMEQSPAHETDVGHNFYEAQSFIGKVVHAVEHEAHKAVDATEHVAKQAIEVTGKVVQVATPETPEAEEATEVTVEAAAGGVIVDGVFTNAHRALLKSTNQECSVEELIDLRSSLMKANKMLK